MSRTGDIRNPQPKYIMRHHQFSEICKPINLFENVPPHNAAFQQIKQYLVLGDLEFKKKFCEDKRNETNNSSLKKLSRKQSRNNQDKLLSTIQHTNLNTITEIKYKTEGDVFNQKVEDKCRFGNSQGKAMFRFNLHKEKQKKIDNFLRKKLSERANKTMQETMSYKRKQIQIYPNPELIHLINNNIPEYFEHSLRDYHGRLKRHVKGNQYGKFKADQMLKTEKGKKQLVSSIPRISQDSFMDERRRNGKLALGGKRLESLNQSFSCWRTKTEGQPIPKLYCEEVFKIQYDSKYRVSQR